MGVPTEVGGGRFFPVSGRPWLILVLGRVCVAPNAIYSFDEIYMSFSLSCFAYANPEISAPESGTCPPSDPRAGNLNFRRRVTKNYERNGKIS